MFQFPFGTLHQLNLDWFLQQWEIYKQEWADAQAGIDNALQGEIDRVEDAMTDLYNARDAAIQAKDDAQTAAGSVVSDAAQCGADALKSEGFAVGEQDGTPVGAGSPYYQQNAKYYKVEAGTYRYLSEAYAKGEMGGSPVAPGEAGYQDNAKYYKDAADADAQQAHTDAQAISANIDKAEGYAVGTQGGVPVSSGSPYYENNAAYYAGEAQQDKDDADHFKDAANSAALVAEGFSSGTQNGVPVVSGSPYYENNSAYFSSIAAQSTGIALNGLPFFDDFSYTTDGTYTTSSQCQLVFAKNKVTVTKIGNNSTYNMMSMFGNHVKTSGVTFSDSSLVSIPIPAADAETDIFITYKLTNHTTAETNIPQLYIATKDSADVWTNNNVGLAGSTEISRYRSVSVRKLLPAAFTNNNITLAVRIRSACTFTLEYSITINYNKI